MSNVKFIPKHDGTSRRFLLADSKSRVDYLLACIAEYGPGHADEASMQLWQWIKQGLILRRDFIRFCSELQSE